MIRTSIRNNVLLSSRAVVTILRIASCAAFLVACDSGRLDGELAALKARVEALETRQNWVLWAHWAGGMMRTPDGGLYNPYGYQIVAAYTSRANCENALAGTKLTTGYDRLLCLPDTVKPQ